MDMQTTSRRSSIRRSSPTSRPLDVGDGHGLIGSCAATRTASQPSSSTAVPAPGCSPTIAASSIPTSYNVLLFDQRGCGRSTPLRQPRREHDLGPGRRHREAARRWSASRNGRRSAASWGSTLALAYAQTHPDRVTELVLRGVFLFQQYELDWMYKDGGASQLYPDKWDEFVSAHPGGRARRRPDRRLRSG